MGLAVALERLGALVVEGVTSYAPDETPDALGGAQLPALVIAPEWGGGWPGLEPSALAAGFGRLEARVAQVLLLAPVAAGDGSRGMLPALAAAIDAYMSALAADPTLGGALIQPARVRVAVGVAPYGGIDYHAATFAHEWVLRVAVSG
ncbi:MAG TPA: hypothetical protein PKD46_16630 [Aggregatilineaceae bacterium]|nr:hypothetical protein [Aggregatilineaceae bacterium]